MRLKKITNKTPAKGPVIQIMNHKSRIRNTAAYLQPIADNASFYITLPVSSIDSNRMRRIGFKNIEPGEIFSKYDAFLIDVMEEFRLIKTGSKKPGEKS